MKRNNFLLIIFIALTIPGMAQTAFYDVTAADGNGLRFWSDNSYKIHMGNGTEYHYGPVTDFSIKTNMSGYQPGRGWTWGVAGATPVAAIDIGGNMQVAGTSTSSGDTNVGLDNSSTTGYGVKLNLLGASANTDALWLSRYNYAFNSSDLRINIGDDNMGDDALDIGYTFSGDAQWRSLIRVLNDGNIGIGTTSPAVWFGSRTLEFADVRPVLKLASTSATGISTIVFTNTNVNPVTHAGEFHMNYSLNQSDNSKSSISFYGYPSGYILTLRSDGKVGIGTTSPDQLLTVNGTIHSKEVKVDLSVPAPDYVFEKDYNLPSLDSIKIYIDQHKHLPEMPSANEMETNGVNLGEMNMLLLKKMEEMTLYMIELKKENERQRSDYASQQKNIEELRLRIK